MFLFEYPPLDLCQSFLALYTVKILLKALFLFDCLSFPRVDVLVLEDVGEGGGTRPLLLGGFRRFHFSSRVVFKMETASLMDRDAGFPGLSAALISAFRTIRCPIVFTSRAFPHEGKYDMSSIISLIALVQERQALFGGHVLEDNFLSEATRQSRVYL